jgi:hypothetical protein
MAALRASALVLLAIAGGCASDPAPDQILTPFHDDDFAYWSQPGSYKVAGTAAFKRDDGQVLTCAGQDVLLLPLTGYTMELSKLLESGQGFPPNYERRARKYQHKATCNADGKFSIGAIPSANWLVATHVSWTDNSTVSSIPWVGGWFGGPTNAGGWLFREIKVHDADTFVALGNDDFAADKQ